MRNLRRRGKSGVWYVVVDIPADVRRYFDGRRQVWTSLRTESQSEALRAAAPIIAGVRDKIAAFRDGGITIEVLSAALERWINELSAQVQAREQESVRDHAPPPLPSFAFDQWRLHGLDNYLTWALKTQGIVLEPQDPLLPGAQTVFLRLWGGAKKAEAFRRYALQEPAAHTAPPREIPTISGLTERYATARQLAGRDVSDVRTYLRRLVEFLGDLPITQVTPDALDRFKSQLRRFPNSKRPDILAKPFNQIINEHGDDPSLRRLSVATVRRKWFGAFNRVFGYAVELELIDRNPVTRVIPKKSEEVVGERKPFDAGDIRAIFSTPLFMGHSGAGRGYRTKQGATVTRDAAYWLPILALWHGFRVEEIGGMKTADMRQEDGVWVFDLTRRNLKTRESRRLVPVHPKMIELGLRTYRDGQAGKWLFPDLPHDPHGKLASTRIFTKWWGLWCERNGFTEREKTFHSFRHTYKRCCREAGIPEEVHDLLTGHKGAGGVGRSYGRGADIKVLAAAAARLDYPTFPL